MSSEKSEKPGKESEKSVESKALAENESHADNEVLPESEALAGNQALVQAVKDASSALKDGQLVAFPTETVYGLGADAKNVKALELIFAAKGRPSEHPLIVHVAGVDEAEKWAAEFPDSARALARVFWPGPLTIVLKKSALVPELVCGGQDTVALRVPNHPVALALLQEFGSGIAAPSANKFGRLSPTSADDVKAEFSDSNLLVLDGGPCELGIESTIVDLSSGKARVLRPGMIQQESIRVVLEEAGAELELTTESKGVTGKASSKTQNSNSEAAESLSDEARSGPENLPRVPGTLDRHYSPQTELKLVESKAFLEQIEGFERDGKDTAVLSFHPAPFLHKNWILAKNFPAHYAHNLYRNLRKLDNMGADLIAVEMPPETEEWAAILDRLKRASGLGASQQKGGSADGS